ncbi:MAG: aminopeptidase [Candidatus Aenigmarchaeota archaeon]|nr:aminopeptidase [Candidatus Aenigmarchaeota archaeon]
MSLLDKISKDKKTKYQKLEEKLALKKKSAWEQFTDKQRKEAFKLCDDYKSFLDRAKTEREAVKEIEAFAKKKGFSEIGEAKELTPGSRVYDIYRNKNAALVIAGKRPITEGARIIVSHVDSPRLDLKPHPLYEDSGLAMMKTHYYGGIKKYQWVNRPFALHGVVTKKDGTTIDIVIGESEKDPVFVISDLLIHLSKNSQDKRLASEALKGEELNIIAGNIPVTDDKVKHKVKLAILEHLYDKYGIIEEDFASAEIEAVPAGTSKDVGFDRSLIGAYGQDDKVCAFASLAASDSVKIPEHTTIILFYDKEEIGSVGNTGARSNYIEYLFGELLEMSGKHVSDIEVRKALMKSSALSADVSAAVNPTFKDVHDAHNSSFCGFGALLEKYNGYGGKYSASDASAEYVGIIRKMLNDNKIPWQLGELGKVDEGGGSTIPIFFSNYSMDIIDLGVAVLGMHSPFEIVSKADMYSAYLAYAAFLES